MGERHRSVRRARRQRRLGAIGYIVTWDVDSADQAMCSRVRRFVFGTSMTKGTRTYAYPGLVDREGVLYLGQSVLFVTQPRLAELRGFLAQNGVAHHVFGATLRAG